MTVPASLERAHTDSKRIPTILSIPVELESQRSVSASVYQASASAGSITHRRLHVGNEISVA